MAPTARTALAVRPVSPLLLCAIDLETVLHNEGLAPPQTPGTASASVQLPNLLWARIFKAVGQIHGTLPVLCDLISHLVGTSSDAGALNVLVYNACLSALKAQAPVPARPRTPRRHASAPASGVAAGSGSPEERALWTAVTAMMRALQVALPAASQRERALAADVVWEIKAGRDARTPAMAPTVQLAWSLVGLMLVSGHAPSAGSVNCAAEVALLARDPQSAVRFLQMAQRLSVQPSEHTLRVVARSRQAAAGDAPLLAQLRQCEQALRGLSAPVSSSPPEAAARLTAPTSEPTAPPARPVVAAAVYEAPTAGPWLRALPAWAQWLALSCSWTVRPSVAL